MQFTKKFNHTLSKELLRNSVPTSLVTNEINYSDGDYNLQLRTQKK